MSKRHLEDMEDFVRAFAKFQHLLEKHGVAFDDEENSCRLFDVWLCNAKDERVIEAQMIKEPWEQQPWDD